MSDNPHDATPDKNKASEMVIVGFIKGAWGIHGAVKVEAASDSPERFSIGSLLYLDHLPVKVEESFRQRGSLVLKLEGVSSRSDAEVHRGKPLHVPSSAVPTLSEGIYYHFQIIGMQVWTTEAEYLGIVGSILSTGSNDVYVVIDGDRELLVPALEEVVLEVDVEGRRMTVDLPEGLR